MHPELVRVAAGQGAAFTRAQALLFHSERTLRHWLQLGQVERIGPGVFGIRPVPSDPMSRIRQVQLMLGQPMIACGPTAAALHGFWGTIEEELHLTTNFGLSLHPPSGIVLHQMVPRSPLVEVNGQLVTAAADTAIDLAASARSIDRLAILDGAASHGISVPMLLAAVDRAAGQRGIIDVQRLAPYSSAKAESPMESRARQRILEAGLPAPEVQLEVQLPSGLRRIDLGYRAHRVGVEYDGEEFHSGDGSLRRDRRRHNAFVGSRWTMLYLTGEDVYRSPREFLSTLEALVGRAAA